jgi:hypothetical protein
METSESLPGGKPVPGAAADAAVAEHKGEESKNRLARLFNIAVDSKPWWAIILVSVLGATGAEGIKAIPGLFQYVSSFQPLRCSLFVWMKDKVTGEPIHGATVSIQKGSQGLIHVTDAGEDYVQTSNGIAEAHLRVKPGPGYVIVLEYKVAGNTYVTHKPIEITADAQHIFIFDTNDRDIWSLKGSKSTPISVVVPSGPTNSTQVNLPRWMKIAYSELGQGETIGSQFNPRHCS